MITQTHNPQLQIAYPEPENGFTLLEVIIAITIGTAIILVSTAALRIGLSHMENGEEWLNDTVRDATAYDFFWQQVSSIRSIDIPEPTHLRNRFGEGDDDPDSEENKKTYFKGNTDSMSFITPLSIKSHYGHGLIIATYFQKDSYDGVDLVYKEKRLNPSLLSSISDDIFDMDDEKNEVVIFAGCDDIEFKYLKTGGDENRLNNDTLSNLNTGDGHQEWTGTIENRLPRAIRIIIRKEDDEEKELIAPVMVMYSL